LKGLSVTPLPRPAIRHRMPTNIWLWILFNAGVLCALAIYLFAVQKRAHTRSAKEAAVWTAVWLLLSLGFNAVIWHSMGQTKGLDFLTGYLVEYSLSVDNIFVFVLIFSYFRVPETYRHRVLFWGILSALILRGFMIGVAGALIETFHWVVYPLGAFLLFTGLKTTIVRKPSAITGNPLIKLVPKLLPVSDSYDGGRFVTRQNGRWLLTPLAMALIVIEATDVIFAVDSIPAIFGITRDPFIVYTSNVCAILGLRSLYFLLAEVVHKFVYLKPALAVILCFIGIKIVLTDICPIPTAVSLGIVGLILLSAIGLSLLLRPSGHSAAKPTPKSHDHAQPAANTR
jgi:tellurite resistance protein TerC